MFVILINKILILLFFLSLLNILRHSYYFIQAWITSESDKPKKYMLSSVSLYIVALSIAYILMSIFYGITL